MAWVKIISRTIGGLGTAAEPHVSVARRKEPGEPRIHFSLNGHMLAALGWKRGDRVGIEHDADTGRIRISKGGDKKLTAQKGSSHKGSSCSAVVPNSGNGARRAEIAPHVIEDGAIIITLPAWAAPQRAGMAAAQAARDAAMARVSPAVLQMGVRPLPREPYVGSQGKRA